MIKARMVVLVCLLPLATWAQGQVTGSPAGRVGKKVSLVETYGKLPLAFEANQGQASPEVKFLSSGGGYHLSLTPTAAVLDLNDGAQKRPAALAAKTPISPGPETPAFDLTRSPVTPSMKSTELRLKLVGGNVKTEIIGQDELPGKSHYFLGNDPKKWCTNVRQFAKVRYQNVYPGVDLVYYGHQRELEYDFVLQPGADPQRIRLGIDGARNLRFEGRDVVLTTAVGDVYMRSPRLYQEQNGKQREVRGGYVIQGKNQLAFRVGSYDRKQALVIDPILAYSTFVNTDGGLYGVALDPAANAYVVGLTPFQGIRNLVITKINADGSSVLYQTYLGGSGDEYDPSITVDAAGNAYVTGQTASVDFPIQNALQTSNHGDYDAFVTKIGADGKTLVYSTYLGGSAYDAALGIAVDGTGNVYVVGTTGSTDFPTVNALQSTALGQGDAFVTKINATGSAFVYSTYLSGSDLDYASGVVADTAGNAYVIGATGSKDFPTANALQPYHGGRDAFLSKINASGSAFIYSTFLGGSGEEDTGAVAVDSANNVYLVGSTTSTDFPTVNPIQATNSGGYDVFVAKINAGGNALVYSSYLGGSGNDRAYTVGIGGGENAGIAVDQAGNLHIAGITDSSDFPVLKAIQPTNGGGDDAFIAEIDAGGDALVYSTYLGGDLQETGAGLAVDSLGSTYVAGLTFSEKFPTTPGASDRSIPDSAYLVKIAANTFVSALPREMNFPAQLVGTTGTGKTVTLTNKGATTLGLSRIYLVGQNPSDFVETNTCGQTLAPGAKCTIAVRLSPSVKGPRQAALVISDSDPASPQAVALSGSGTVVSLSKKELSFGDQTVGISTAPQNVSLVNVSSTSLKLTGITITGPQAGDFSQNGTCGTSVAPVGACRISVIFKPTASGTRTATLNIQDSGGGSPQKVTLTGTGN